VLCSLLPTVLALSLELEPHEGAMSGDGVAT